MLLKSVKKIKKSLKDLTPLGEKCIRVISPEKSLKKIIDEENYKKESESLVKDEMYKVVKQLVYYGHAKLIVPITATSLYRITPKVCDISEDIILKWNQSYKGREIHSTIQSMFGSGPTNLEQISRVEKRPMKELLVMTIFMMKNGLL